MKTNKKLMRPVLISFLAALIVSAGCLTAFAVSSMGIEGPVYMTLVPSGTAGVMNCAWWDAPEITQASLQYGTSEDALNQEAAAAMVSSAEEGYTAWNASMTGLTGGETYYYRVGSQAGWSAVCSFVMPDPGDDEVSLLYLGDAQYGEYTTKDEDYAAFGALLNTAVEQNPDLDLALMGGDMVQANKIDGWQDFLSNADAFASLPVLTVPGNHESNTTTGKPQLYLDLLPLPNNGPTGFEEEFYSYDVGDCHIQCLSSNVLSYEQLTKGSMTADDFTTIKNWIANDMAASNKTWKIVVMHHPAYAVVPDGVADVLLDQWAPLFEQAQVDLVLCGHQHVYMRTKVLHGVTYVMGVSGGKHYATADVTYDACQIGDISNYQVVRAGSTELTMTCYAPDGTELDSVTLSPKDRSQTPVWSDVTGDLNADGVVDSSDVAVLLTAIKTTAAYDYDKDLNRDDVVNILDALALANMVSAAG